MAQRGWAGRAGWLMLGFIFGVMSLLLALSAGLRTLGPLR